MNTMAKYKDIFVDLMMAYELELQIPGEDDNPWKDGAITFTSFVIFGLVPLLGYLILFSIPGYTQQDMFIAACILTALTLFALGAIKTKVTKQNWFKGGFEILIMGSSTALAAYFIGFLVKLAIEGGESSSLH